MLLQSFANRNVKALVIEPQTQIRAMMQDVLREAGFVARAAANMKEGVACLEAERFDWILMPPSMECPINFMHILGHAIRNPQWRQLRMSLLMVKDEPDIIGQAMEYGGLSWHVGPFTKETFALQIKTLMDQMFNYGFLSDMVSAAYVRDISVPDSTKERIAVVEQSIVQLHPGNLNLLMEAADSCRKLGAFERSLLLLTQARLLDETPNSPIEKKLADVQAEMTRTTNSTPRKFTAKEILGFNSVAIIDPDSAMQQFMEKCLRETGVAEVNVFSDGNTFIDWFNENEPEMIIMEWRIPGTTGAKLLQRIATRPNRNPPQCILLSSSLGNSDMPLLKELGVGAVVGKPVSRNDFMGALLKTQAGATQPAGVYFEQQIRAMIRSRKMDKASKLAEAFLINPEVSEGRKLLIQADIELTKKNYEPARYLCLKAMSLPHDTLYGLQILGKCFMGLRQFDFAMKCFDKAQAMSPMNIERICLMAVSEAEQGHNEAANVLVDAAKSVDSKNEMVLETAVNVSVVQGDIAKARKNIGNLPNIMGVVAFQNNRAVAMSKTQRFSESIEVYQKTMEVLPEKAHEATDIVLFNLALAYVKSDDLAMAEETLGGIGKHGKSRVSAKAEDLRKRLGASVSSGVKLILKTHDPVTMLAPNSGETVGAGGSDSGPSGGGDREDMSNEGIRMLSLVDFKPGDLGCFKLFVRETSTDDELQHMLNSLPSLKIKWTPTAKS